MGIRFACHECGKRLNIKSELAGRRGVCPACSAKMRIPLSDTEKSTPVEELAPFPQPSAPSASAATSATAAPSAPAVSSPAAPLSEHEPEATWYVRPPSGGQYGPASTDLLQQWIEEGRVAASSLLWRDGWPQWRTATEALPELAGRLPGAPVAGPFSSASAESATAPLAATPLAAGSLASGALASGALAAGSAANAPLASGSAGAETITGEVAFAGQSTIGSQRRARSSRRVLWIGLLSALAIMLVGVLVVVANLG